MHPEELLGHIHSTSNCTSPRYRMQYSGSSLMKEVPLGSANETPHLPFRTTLISFPSYDDGYEWILREVSSI
jgi:hypothetical protein